VNHAQTGHHGSSLGCGGAGLGACNTVQMTEALLKARYNVQESTCLMLPSFSLPPPCGQLDRLSPEHSSHRATVVSFIPALA
jgi:hypothetical protein